MKVAPKDQIVERAREVVAGCTRRDDNIRKLDEIINDGNTKRTKMEPWNEIIARTCEGYSSVDGNIVCPTCMNVTPNIVAMCLHCHGRFFSCGVKNVITTSTTIEIDDDEVEVVDDVEMEQPKGPEKEEQENIDQAKMDEIKTALQSQIEHDDEDEEVSLEFIDNLTKNLDALKGKGHEVSTPSFDADEVDYGRDSQAPEIEEVIDEVDAIYRSTTEFPKSSDKVIEEVETEDQKAKFKKGRTHEEEYEGVGPRSMDPDVHLANHELPKWCRYPEPVPYDLQDEAGCQDTGKGSSGLMDRYVVRYMPQLMTPMYRSFHQTGITEFKQHFMRKRLDAMSDFTNGVFNGFDKEDMPLDPTEEQMQNFADSKWLIPMEAWHILRGERTIGRFALQAIAFGYTPTSFKAERDQRPPGTAQAMVEESKKSKQDAMSTVRKCVNAVYNVTSYSYSRDDLNNSDIALTPWALSIQDRKTNGAE